MRARSVLLATLATAALLAAARVREGGEQEPRPFPSFALETFDGDSLALADLRGKVALVTFWASWCPACRTELPPLDSLYAAVDHPDFPLLAVNDEWNEGAARGYAAALGLRMPLLLGRGAMQRRYEYWGLPYTVLLDREGRVIYEYYGYPGRKAFDAEVVGRVRAELDR